MTYAQQRLTQLGIQPATPAPKPLRRRNARPDGWAKGAQKFGHITAHDLWLMRELRKGGMPVTEIAEKFEVPRNFVGRVMRHEVPR